MTQPDPEGWTPPAHWAEAEAATELGARIPDDAEQVALAPLSDSTLLILGVVAHFHGIGTRELGRLVGRPQWSVRRKLRQLIRAGFVECEPRPGDDHWIATIEGTRLGVVPYVTRLLASTRLAWGYSVLPNAFARVGSVRGPLIFSPAFALSSVTDPEKLGEAIRHGTLDDQAYALTKLVAGGDQRAARILIEVAQRRGEHELKLSRRAVTALAAFDTPETIDALIDIAGHRDSLMREASVRSLGRLRATRAEPVLIRELHYPSPPVRAAALHALERIGDPSAAAQIAVALDDPDRRVRHYGRHALIRLGGVEQLRDHPRTWPWQALDLRRTHDRLDHLR